MVCPPSRGTVPEWWARAKSAPLPTLRFELSNRPFEPTKAGRAGERFECRIALFLGKGEAGLAVASLGRLIADQERDRRALVAGSLSCRERMADQGLHQPASAMRRPRRDMFDQ